MYIFFLKRVIDFSAAFFGLILLSPIFLVVTIFLAFANEGKPFFFQKRMGKKGNLFSIVKFKTMNDRKDKYGNLLPDDVRLTKIGKFVRKTSLDELPQLFNVLKGEMSLIGPRPLLPHYISFYTETQMRRHEVLPGITGWAQVNGRNNISWEEKFCFDVWYVENTSFIIDSKILFLTLKKIIKPEGINDPNGNITEAFDKYMLRKNGQ
ncbi:sugar transferase [Pedobacter sp. 22226]|uniref:sugar transferase n=1 Tax=Pedobacter sp. 22226 TaxID=3453894 RepID=UPI003F84E900